jgi:hypothetical protein
MQKNKKYHRKKRHSRNSLAKGVRLENYEVEEGETMLSVLKDGMEPLVSRIAAPTSGVYAELYLSECNACEPVYDDRAQDWSVFKTDEPTGINALDLASRYQNPGDLKAKGFESPIINIQNAPAAPDPTGINAMSNLLGTQGLFKDMTGLEGTQKIALDGMLGNQKAAQNYASMAGELTKLAQQNFYADKAARMIDTIKKSGLPKDDQNALIKQLLDKATGGDDKQNPANPATTPTTETFNEVVKNADKRGITPTRYKTENAETGETHGGESAYPNTQWTGQDGCWLKSDREQTNQRWKNAAEYNVSNCIVGRYAPFKQVLALYNWLKTTTKIKGHDVKWTHGAISLVLPAVNSDKNRTFAFYHIPP